MGVSCRFGNERFKKVEESAMNNRKGNVDKLVLCVLVKAPAGDANC